MEKKKKNRENNDDLKIYIYRALNSSRTMRDLLFHIFVIDRSCFYVFSCKKKKKHVFTTFKKTANMTNSVKWW